MKSKKRDYLINGIFIFIVLIAFIGFMYLEKRQFLKIDTSKNIDTEEEIKGDTSKPIIYDYKVILDTLDSIGHFYNGIAFVRDHKGRGNYATKNGDLLIDWMIYDWSDKESDNGVERFENGDYRGPGKKKWGFLNKTGSVYIPFEYDFAYPFSEGLAGVVKNNKVGFIDTKGTQVIDFEFDYAHDYCGFSEGMANITINNKEGFINKKGNIVVPTIYSDCSPYFSNGLVFVKDEKGNAYFIDKKGKVIIDFSKKPYFVDVSSRDFSCERLRIKDDNSKKYGFIDKTGEIVIPCKYYECFDFSNGIAGVVLDSIGFYGFINKSGTLVLPYKYNTMNDRQHWDVTKAYSLTKNKQKNVEHQVDSILINDFGWDKGNSE